MRPAKTNYIQYLLLNVRCHNCGPSCIAVGYIPRCNGCGQRFTAEGSAFLHVIADTPIRGQISLTRSWPLRSIEGVPTKV